MLCVSGMVILIGSENASAYAPTGTASSPLSSLTGEAGIFDADKTYYIKVGGAVNIYAVESESFLSPESVTQGYGLTVSNNSITGTVSNAGTIVVGCMFYEYGSGNPCNITIVAVSTQSFTISFNGNGGSASPSSQSATSGNSITLPSPGSRTNYSFSGWYTESSGGSYVGGIGNTYTVTSSLTLHAHWTYVVPSQYYYAYLYYDANGGSGAPGTQSNSMYGTSASGSVSFTVSSTAPIKSGCTFLGWSTSSGASSALYTSGDGVSISYGSSMTLYAVWQQNTITITSSQASTTIVTGGGFNYAVSCNVSGVILSISGAEWLSVSGSNVIGTPTSAGTYTVTITAAKIGYISDTQSFTLTVQSQLAFTSFPSNGVVAYAL